MSGEISKGRHLKVNGYTTKRVVDLSIKGAISVWNEVKPGSIFRVYFSRNNTEWLKVANDGYEERLNRSYLAQLTVFELQNIHNLLPDCSLVEVNEKEIVHRGMIIPHLGPSIEYLLKEPDCKYNRSDLTDLYYQSYLVSKKLLDETGLWVDDPNPGNVIIHNHESDTVPILIDISSENIRRRPTHSNHKKLFDNFVLQGQKSQLDFKKRQFY
jgi:hypothetical protein